MVLYKCDDDNDDDDDDVSLYVLPLCFLPTLSTPRQKYVPSSILG